MKRYLSRKWLVASVGAAAAVLATVGAFLLSTSGSASAHPASSGAYAATQLVEYFAQQAGVQDLRTLVSAGTGRANTAIITGTDGAGSPCWTVIALDGHQGAPFRCGSPPAPESGSLWVGYGTGGGPGSSTADYASLVGLVTSNVT
jgi:hypothetical protein